MGIHQGVGRRGRKLRRRVRQPWRWLPFGLRLRLASIRAWGVRHRLLNRTIRLLLVLLALTVVASSASRARTARAHWGETSHVMVMKTDLAIGDELDATHVRAEVWPTSLLPTDAVTFAPEGDSVVSTLQAGDVLTSRDLRSAREALELPAGRGAVSLPRDPTIPQLVTGDLVDLHVVTDGAWAEAMASDVHAGLVVDVTEEAYVIALERRHIGSVATAVTGGRVVIALR